MLGELTIKATNLCVGCKNLKIKNYAVEALYKSEELFHNKLKTLENVTAVLVK